MLPSGVDLATLLANGLTVVTAFGSVIALVAGLSIGWAVVNWVVSKLRKAGR